MSIDHTAHQARTWRYCDLVTTSQATAPARVRPPFRARRALMHGPDHVVCPDTRHAVATIADRLRRLPCADSVVAMDLHRIARELEKIAAAAGPTESRTMPAGAAAPSPTPLGVE